MTKHLFIFGLLLVLLGNLAAPAVSRADDGILVAPAVFDRKVKARDILSETIVIANTTDHDLRIYPVVQNITIQNGERSFDDSGKADLSTSLANWIYFTRGLVELHPGDRRTLDLRIEVNLNAKPGMYHAVIAFPTGNIRAEAENNARTAPNMMVNIEVLDNTREALELTSFASAASFFFRAPASFAYTIGNIGNRPLAPRGSIIIYNSSGREIGTGPINPNGTTIEPDRAQEFTDTWRPEAFRFGRYKAFLDLQYGAGAASKIQDTIYFWIVPWYVLLLLLCLLLGLSFFVATIVHRRYTLWHHTRLQVVTASHQDLMRRLAAVPPPLPPTVRPAAHFVSRHFSAPPERPAAPPPPPPALARPIVRLASAPPQSPPVIAATATTAAVSERPTRTNRPRIIDLRRSHFSS